MIYLSPEITAAVARAAKRIEMAVDIEMEKDVVEQIIAEELAEALGPKLTAPIRLPPVDGLYFTNKIRLFRCTNKVFSKSGCTCCWHCPTCGGSGCDNMLSNLDKYEIVDCPKSGQT